MAQEFTTSLVRLSYVNVFEPKTTPQGDEKYSVTCLLPKSDTQGYKALMDAIRAEIVANQDDKLKGVAQPKLPIHDGDGFSPGGSEYGPECKGHWVFTASANAKYPPSIMDKRVQPIMDRSQVYSGCWAHVAISIYAYNNQSRGIGFGLNGLQKVKDDEALGYKFDANKAFQAVADPDAPAMEPGGVDPLTGMPL